MFSVPGDPGKQIEGMMTITEARKAARAAGLYLAIECLKERLFDTTVEVELNAYQYEIKRLEAQLQKLQVRA